MHWRGLKKSFDSKQRCCLTALVHFCRWSRYVTQWPMFSQDESQCNVWPMHYAFLEGGVFTDKTGLKIFVFINAMIFAFTTFVTNTPLYGKIASKVWKIYFQYISPHFLDAAGSQISDLWLLLLSNSSLFSALMSHLPLLLLHSALCTTQPSFYYLLEVKNPESLFWAYSQYG